MSVRLPLNMSEHQCVCVYERMCVCACVYVSGVRVCVSVLMCILICIVFVCCRVLYTGVELVLVPVCFVFLLQPSQCHVFLYTVFPSLC